jgi:hypothetical protein
LETTLGFTSRTYDGYPIYGQADQGFACGLNITCIATTDNFATVGSTLVGDTTQYESFGPISGRAMSLGLKWAPYISGTKIPGSSGPTLTFNLDLDLRHYIKITRRMLFAIRLYGFRATGNLPDVLAFGGLDTLRNLPIYGIYGNTAAFANVEFRFPLIDLLATPILGFTEIRGKLFFDVGGAALKNQPFSFYENGKLTCAALPNGAIQSTGCSTADYGFGVGVNFLGLPLRFDFSRLWNMKQSIGPYRTFFYIAPEF